MAIVCWWFNHECSGS